jgi:hypothetical protein
MKIILLKVMPKAGEKINLDLKLGLEKFASKVPHTKGIDSILKSIIENKDKLFANQKADSPTLKFEQTLQIF